MENMQLPPLSSLMNGTRTDGSLYEDMMGFSPNSRVLLRHARL